MKSRFLNARTALSAMGCVSCLLFVVASYAKGPSFVSPDEAATDAQFAIQGEYTGSIEIDGELTDAGIQLVAMGDGEFQAVGYLGGLPGDGWKGDERYLAASKLQADGKLEFQLGESIASYANEKLTIRADGNIIGSVKKVQRKSPTLGKEPPAGAVVLFDGTSGDAWKGGEMDGDLLVQGQTSKATFGDHSLHIEFRLPYEPENRGQQRGNSGLYLQGRYEVQMLDSFGLEGKDNECGGIYTINPPAVNMCFPPLVWQSYDVDFTAAKYAADGTLASHPRMTVRHNGVLVQKDVELPRKTTAAPFDPSPEPGPVYLQDHSNPVRYRNIWVVPK